jgi:hypothetical protein
MHFSGEISQGVSQAFTQLEKVSSAVNSGTFTVNRDNVLAAAKIVEAEADALQEKVRSIRKDLRVEPPGDDDVSIRMASAWNDILVDNDDSYRNRIMEYIAGLRRLSVQLGDSARSYGYSEDEISAAFGQPSA